MSALKNRSKRDPQKSGMTHAKWREVQSIGRKSKARYIWGMVAGKSGTMVRHVALGAIRG